jgi:hypothetical protein
VRDIYKSMNKKNKTNKSTEPSDIEIAKKLINIHQSSLDRKLEFNLTFESIKNLLSFQTCYYTGRAFDSDGQYARSIDRIDSSKGYIEGNVVSCTIDINGKKANLSEEEIEILYNKIVLPKKIREKIPQRDKTTQAKPGKSERCEFPDFIV